MKIDDKILKVLQRAETSVSEWDIARALYPWDDLKFRAKHGAWVRSIVQALWRLYFKGLVGYFFEENGIYRFWFASHQEDKFLATESLLPPVGSEIK